MSDEDIPIHTEFNRMTLHRSQLQVYHQNLQQKSGLIYHMIRELNHIKNLIDNHIEQTRQVLIEMNGNNIVYQESSILPYRDNEIDIWKSLDTFIKECTDFSNNQLIKIYHDLRSEDYYGQLPYNFTFLSSIKQP
jgi:hypothetical protein